MHVKESRITWLRRQFSDQVTRVAHEGKDARELARINENKCTCILRDDRRNIC